MQISERGIALIKSFEKCRLTAYLPTPNDRWTVGYGHTGPDVTEGTVWTQQKADFELLLDIGRAELGVETSVTVPMTQGEFDACVSLAYNIGVAAFRDSTLVRLLNAGDHEGASLQFKRWNKQKGVVLAGLTRRRAAEAELFEGTA